MVSKVSSVGGGLAPWLLGCSEVEDHEQYVWSRDGSLTPQGPGGKVEGSSETSPLIPSSLALPPSSYHYPRPRLHLFVWFWFFFFFFFLFKIAQVGL